MPADFVCQRCGACCRWPGYVILENSDISALAEALNISERDFINKYTMLTESRSRLSLIENEDGSCVLLKGGDCTVYKARPKQCRDFPKYWTLDGCCPGLDAQD